jgi:NAD(P)H-hydrate epimerase
MSFRGEKDRSLVEETKEVTRSLLTKFPDKRWVIDAGSLQVMDTEWIPNQAILTPNRKEIEMLFGEKLDYDSEDLNIRLKGLAAKHKCIIVFKGPKTLVCSSSECVLITNGNPGLTKGGTGDVLAGLTVALLAKNEPFLAAASASFIAKSAADELHKKVGISYNADDLADKIPEIFNKLML